MASININNTSYNVEDDWLKVAIQYFNIDPESESSVNLLKAGLFGYNNEIQSNEIKNNVYHRNVLYDEHFLNTASFPESISNFAKLNNVPIDLANPSHMRVTMAIRKIDLLNTPFKEEIIDADTLSTGVKRKVYAFELSDNFEFDIESIPFKLPYPVQFIMKEIESSKDFNITARYLVENTDFPYMENMSNPYLKVWNENIASTDYIFVGLDLFQLYKHESTFSITSNDIRDNIYLNKDFNDQLAFVEVYYRYNGYETKLVTYQNNHYLSNDVSEDYCYFTVVDSNTVQISFSSDPNAFRPRMNSEIKLITYTTKGKQGNFSYNGEIRTNFNNNNEFDRIPVKITPITDAKGGYNKLTNTEIKKKVIEEVLGRRNIITDTDLEFFFNNFNNDNAINDSRVSFFKKRHDVLKRLLSGYLLLRDIDGNVVPTNTAPHLIVSEDYVNDPFGKVLAGEAVEDTRGMITENSQVLYDHLNGTFHLMYISDSSELGTYFTKIGLDIRKRYIIDKTKKDDLDIYVDPVEKSIGYILNDGVDDTGLTIYQDIQYKAGINNMMIKIVRYNSIGSVIPPVSIGDDEWHESTDERKEVIGKRYDYVITSYLGEIVLGDKTFDAASGEPDESLIYYKDISNTEMSVNMKLLLDINDRYLQYSIPYVIKILDKPIYKTKYYKTSIYKSYTTKFENINSLVDTNFLINNIEISKEPHTEDGGTNFIYNLSLVLNTNLSPDEISESVIIRMIIADKEKEHGFLEFKNVDGTYKYIAQLTTDNDTITEDERLKILSGLFDISGSAYNKLGQLTGRDALTGGVFLPENIKVQLAVLYDDGVNDYKYGKFNDMPDLVDYTTAVVYSTEDEVQLFKNLNKYIESDVIPVIVEDESTKEKTKYYDVRQVPLVETSYYNLRYNEILDVLDIYDDIILEIVDRLENNDSLDMKFYNTYGASKYWVTDTNGLDFKEENFDYADVTSIGLEFTIYTNKIVTDENDFEIKKFISDFVESCNESGLFAISNLLRMMEETFDYIRYIEFGHVAGEETQKIFNTFDNFVNMSSEEISDFVPEYLNIKKQIGEFVMKDELTGLDIGTYKNYSYGINVTYK